MSDERGPQRWSEPHSDCDPLLRRLIGSARDGLGDAGLAERIEHAVRQRIAAERAPASRTGHAWPTWIGVAVAVLGFCAAVTLLGARQAQQEAHAAQPSAALAVGSRMLPRQAEPAAHAQSAAALAVSSGTVPRGAERSGSGRIADAQRPDLQRAAPASSSEPAAASTAPGRVRRPAVAARSAHKRAAPYAGASNAAETASSLVPSDAPARLASSAGPPPSHSSVPPELAIVSAAQRALRDDPQRALALVEQHARAYPDGRFAEDREEIAISALLALGKHAQARSRAQAFLARFARSLAAPRIAQLLAATH